MVWKAFLEFNGWLGRTMVLGALLESRSNPGDGLQVGYSQRVQFERVRHGRESWAW